MAGFGTFVEVLKSFLGEGKTLSGKSHEAEQEMVGIPNHID
jgi:hypothetical protein